MRNLRHMCAGKWIKSRLYRKEGAFVGQSGEDSQMVQSNFVLSGILCEFAGTFQQCLF